MKQRYILLLVLFLALFLGTSVVIAHVPIDATGNTDLASAQEVTNPTKSWAIYSNLESGEDVSFFSFEMGERERIYTSLFVPARQSQQTFLPEFALMGPGLETQGSVPDYVETTGSVFVAESQREEPSFEPFGPSHVVEVASIDLPAPETGTYYIAIFSRTGAGHFGMAIGTQESFTLTELILNPVNVMEVYRWQGQNWLLITLPFVLTLLAGYALLYRTFGDTVTTLQLLLATIGFAFLSSSVSFTYQIVYNLEITGYDGGAILSLVIAGIQALLATGVLTMVPKSQRILSPRQSLRLLLLSLVAAVVWVGIIIGPIMGVITSVTFLIHNTITSLNLSSTTT